MTAKSTIPKAPKGLGEAGKAAWRLAWSVPWTHEADTGIIEHLCRLEDQAAQLGEVIDRDGVTLTKAQVTPRGEVVGTEFYENPALKSLRAVDKQLIDLRNRLGLDPASRARLRLEAIEGPDAVDELKERRDKRRAALGR
jgi:P27 family predicted phage terminase small subunit